jgi:hypothetical protein
VKKAKKTTGRRHPNCGFGIMSKNDVYGSILEALQTDQIFILSPEQGLQ